MEMMDFDFASSLEGGGAASASGGGGRFPGPHAWQGGSVDRLDELAEGVSESESWSESEKRAAA